MKPSLTVRWILGAFGIFFLLFLCIAPLMARVFFMSVGTVRGFDNEAFRGRRAAFAQERQNRSDSNEQTANAQSENEETVRERGSRRGHHAGRHGHHDFRRGGFSPIGAVFGLFGGLVRLTGLGLLAMAALIWIRPQMNGRKPTSKRHQASDDNKDDDDDDNAGQWI
ncbi:MAG: hypothetical protein AAF629_02555 [Chloroflexota bacterium]